MNMSIYVYDVRRIILMCNPEFNRLKIFAETFNFFYSAGGGVSSEASFEP
jgi:hypothetical protein